MTDRTAGADAVWPKLLPLHTWEDTCTTLHMWTQVVGKIRLELVPRINHWWGVALYTTTRGLTTSPMPVGRRSFAIDFDFLDHLLRITDSDGTARSFSLKPMSVAEFFRKTMGALHELDIDVDIFTRPVEVVEAIPFEADNQHASYDADAVHRFWRALVQVERVLTQFRARFIGKVSPVHFFWGGFDLAVTRFSGRTAPRHGGGVPNCADWVMEEAYSHEVSSAASGRGRVWGKHLSTPTPIPLPPDSRFIQFGPRQHTFTKCWASSSCPTRPYERPMIRTKRFYRSFRQRMKVLLSWHTGIGARWNARPRRHNGTSKVTQADRHYPHHPR